MPNLRSALDAMVLATDGYATTAPEGWTQGRTLYGGMTAALSAHAAALQTPGLPPLRSALFSFIGPAAGELLFRPQVLRQGRSATVVSVDCMADGAIAARGQLTYGAARESAVSHQARRIMNVLPPEECEPFAKADRPRPGFFHNFELRLAAGARPVSGPETTPELDAWVRHLDDEGVDPTIAMLALADALPPAAMIQFSQPAPISTMTWMIDLLQPLPAGGGWYLSRSVSETSADGYSQQAMEVFSEDGLRIAVGRQTVAIFA